MRRTTLLVLALLALSGCSSSGDTGTVTPPSATATTAAPTQSATTAALGTAMNIQSFAYNPTPLTVAPGAKIEVRNLDGVLHTVTSDMKGLFLADDVKKGTPVTFTAPKTAGTYTFHCQYHASMHGTLIVKG